MSDFARELGVGHSDLVRLRDGELRMQHGPLMQRLIRLFEALDEHRVRWSRQPPRRPKGRPWHRLEGAGSFRPETAMLYVDFRTQTLHRERRSEDDAVSARAV
jgi:hypothetical protein